MRSLFTPTLRRLIGFSASQRWLFRGSILAMLGYVGAGLALPLGSRGFVNHVISHGDRSAILPWGLLILGLAVLRGASNFLRRNLSGTMSVRVEAEIRQRLIDHVLTLQADFHDAWPTGQLLSRATGDLNAVREFLAFALVFLGILVLVVSGTVVALFSIDWTLGLAVLVFAPTILWAAGAFNRRVGGLMTQSRELVGDVASTVEESASGIRVLKAFGREHREVEHLQILSDELWDTNVRVARIRSRWVPTIGTIPNLMTAAVLGLGGWRVLHHELDLGGHFAAYQYLGTLALPLRNAGWILSMAQSAEASGRRIFAILDSEPSIVDGPEQLAWSGGGIELRHVTVRPEGAVSAAIDDVSLSIPPGQCIALVGPSGSGKSVLASLLWRSRDPDAGTVEIDGIDLRAVTLHSLRSRIGVVFEEALLFRGTVRDNVAFADPTATEDRIQAAATAAGVDQILGVLPDGWETFVGESGFSLSGGQRQRVALARALLIEPDLLILDDPLSAVDPRTERQIEAALTDVVRGRTTVVIAHRASTIRLAERVVVLDAGRVVADGTHEQLMEISELYRALLASAEADADVAARAGLLLEDVS